MIDVCLLGCGGVMPLPSRALTSLFVRYNGKAILVDCGEGTQTALRKAEVKYSQIDVILFTHLHADHISGIIGLLLTFGLEGRTEPLRIYGPEGITKAIECLTVIAPNLPFEIICTELLEEQVGFEEIGLYVNAFKLIHNVECFGYRFELPRLPKFDAEKAKKLEIPVKFWSILQSGESVGGFSPLDVLGEARHGLSLLYATDTRPTDALEFFGKGADLMVLEGMYGDTENQCKAGAGYHLTMREAAEIARAAGARELWLTHYSPSVADPMIYESEIKSIFGNTVMGRDCLFKKLKFD